MLVVVVRERVLGIARGEVIVSVVHCGHEGGVAVERVVVVAVVVVVVDVDEVVVGDGGG